MRYLLHQVLEEAADRHPDAPAVIDPLETWSYRRLDRRADRIANLLAELGVAKGDRVGIYADKSAWTVATLYAVLKAGGVYVPLDVLSPPDRLEHVLRDAGIALVVASPSRARGAAELSDRVPGLAAIAVGAGDETGADPLPCFSPDRIDARPPSPPAAETIDRDLAYILYTSGSTGTPKGVMLSHRNALAFVEWAGATFDVTSEDRLASHAPLHFDLSVFDLYVAAWAAATVVLLPASASIFPASLASSIERHRITVWYSVPSVLVALATRGGLRSDRMATLRAVLFAGEVFPPGRLRELMELLPGRRFANLYGPTESNVCSWYDIPAPPDGTDPIPIGRAVANTELWAVTDSGRRARQGEIGELHVRGATVMCGYWGDPDRTALRLIPHESGVPGDLVLRTGDLVRVGPAGEFTFIGRRDHQVKRRGFRIELGDIEAAVTGHPQVCECAAVVVADATQDLRIVVFAAPDAVSEAEILAHCRKKLPHYMIPDEVRIADSLPKTSTHKVDRQRLIAGTSSREDSGGIRGTADTCDAIGNSAARRISIAGTIPARPAHDRSRGA
ncbi:amino acid adenylation domain-containing protein [Nocardia terpenica]|uniref:amino acid adenylation domain-containing protein n=1 Tax=Nocardia terpenica TaxID=455432 RepID=UPI001894268C|nr:amino acid adenylation domain-containing protein [Nocardia terpenica]MBF6064440.1 amino acid adenylation domain-containing protein [Nocardia terpenica]MBF6106936.1 amino acid adenylation domain-containing protein [Nocardia terpenica]MBF6114408.1 amino acid adenylation domain-containing protein [Nocardia terpenica]MBF6121506.1 amino acid adenylation domain-containing protein [Nocardia terpenica]MBF6153921.1 amino acid adenylation domain-containing protein [Nocardia terpenica]